LVSLSEYSLALKRKQVYYRSRLINERVNKVSKAVKERKALQRETLTINKLDDVTCYADLADRSFERYVAANLEDELENLLDEEGKIR
jgi:predicted ABC-type exoprotein transport system permease subunit